MTTLWQFPADLVREQFLSTFGNETQRKPRHREKPAAEREEQILPDLGVFTEGRILRKKPNTTTTKPKQNHK